MNFHTHAAPGERLHPGIGGKAGFRFLADSTDEIDSRARFVLFLSDTTAPRPRQRPYETMAYTLATLQKGGTSQTGFHVMYR